MYLRRRKMERKKKEKGGKFKWPWYRNFCRCAWIACAWPCRIVSCWRWDRTVGLWPRRDRRCPVREAVGSASRRRRADSPCRARFLGDSRLRRGCRRCCSFRHRRSIDYVFCSTSRGLAPAVARRWCRTSQSSCRRRNNGTGIFHRVLVEEMKVFFFILWRL